MKWEESADEAVSRLPFSARRKVRARAETAALNAGRDAVIMADVECADPFFAQSLIRESNGYRLDICAGTSGCPNRAHGDGCGDDSCPAGIAEDLRKLLEKENLSDFLRQHVKGPIRPHHEFRVALADCPNACSQPQIKDIGIIAAALPGLTDKACIQCGACENACRENAIVHDHDQQTPVIDYDRCISCGKCSAACPSGKINVKVCGYRVMTGGKLGRHPRLADELPGIHDAETVLFIVRWCLDVYREKSTRGRRFAEIVAEAGDSLLSRLDADIKTENNRKKRR